MTDVATGPSQALLPKFSSTAADLLEAFSRSFNLCTLVYTLTSWHTSSHHGTPHHVTSPHLTSHHLTSHHITSHHITSHHITSHHITSHHVTQHSRRCLLTQSGCLYAIHTHTDTDRIRTCTLGGNGTGISRDQSPTAMAAAEDDTPVSYVLKLCPVLCTTCF